MQEEAITFDMEDRELVRNVKVENLTEDELMLEIKFLHMVRRHPETSVEERVKADVIISKLLAAMLEEK